MRVVLDTNIIVSGLAYAGNERPILDSARNRRYALVLSEFILHEARGVMPRKFNWDSARVTRALSRLATIATLIDPPRISEPTTGHPPDDQVLACVAAAEADFLVTGDRRHLLPLRTFGNARIVTAAEFLEELEASDS